MIGQRIALLRRDAQLSQAELARRLQVSPSAVGMYEQGRREPSAETLVALAEIFHVSTDYLLTGRATQTADEDVLVRVLNRSVLQVDQQLQLRKDRPFTRQELAVLLMAVLMES